MDYSLRDLLACCLAMDRQCSWLAGSACHGRLDFGFFDSPSALIQTSVLRNFIATCTFRKSFKRVLLIPEIKLSKASPVAFARRLVGCLGERLRDTLVNLEVGVLFRLEFKKVVNSRRAVPQKTVFALSRACIRSDKKSFGKRCLGIFSVDPVFRRLAGALASRTMQHYKV